MNTAICMAGLFFTDKKMVKAAMEDDLGVRPQMTEAVTDEGFWYECSVQYHFLAAHSLLSIFRWLAAYGKLDKQLKDLYRKMLLFPRDIAFPDGSLPNPHDGFTAPTLSRLKYILEEALPIFPGDTELLRLYSLLKQEYGEMRNLNTLLFEQDTTEIEPADITALPSRSFPGSRITMLRNENATVFFKYGHHLHGRPSHAHPDQMTVEYYFINEVINRDLGTPGYSSPLMLKWFRTSPSHNTVTMDQRNQDSLEPGSAVVFDRDNNRTAAEAKRVYKEGVKYLRDLKLTDNELTDIFSAEAGEEHTFDWFTHVSGKLAVEADLSWEDTVLAEHDDSSPYHHLYGLQRTAANGDVTFLWDFPAKTVTAELKGIPGTEIYRFKSYDLPATNRRDGIMIRRKGQKVDFTVVWRFQPKNNILNK
ncbi:MAG: heparinase II/III family protein [Spirochaetia bacterium]